MKEILRGKKLLITGGAGSVGSALTKALLQYDPETIRILDLSENEMFKMRIQFGTERSIRYLNGDIRDISRLKLAMEDIDIVIHLAAMKHVYACEYNPFEAIKTNVDGLQNVIDAARNEGVERVLFASTDKAVSPSSVMGMTKLLGEKLISLANYYKGKKRTLFSCMRFGNVMGSNGSVLPVFRKQIGAGGPVTITDKDMTRFVITMEEAISLIYSTIKLAKGGETFVWKMRTLRVSDLVNVMVEKYGRGRRIEIKVIGRGEGEKIHEEILSEEELSHAIELDNLYIVFPVIDHLHVDRKYKDAKGIEEPIIVSSKGRHMSEKDIAEFLENLEAERC